MFRGHGELTARPLAIAIQQLFFCLCPLNVTVVSVERKNMINLSEIK